MDLNVDARCALTDEQIVQVDHWRARQDDELQTVIARAEAKRLASAIIEFRTKLLSDRF
ncbi:hypothetical protein [Paeniglutamicibacter antarcticus]|uniref:Uncharacterized protein n=1 Tax=Paeniglutamicibacter antarcticus TaxID=494023 RepID=A0ABP9TRL3_9MICC